MDRHEKKITEEQKKRLKDMVEQQEKSKAGKGKRATR